MNASWIWNPDLHPRRTSLRGSGTDSYDPVTGPRLGDYTSGNILSGQVDYIASSQADLSASAAATTSRNNTNRLRAFQRRPASTALAQHDVLRPPSSVPASPPPAGFSRAPRTRRTSTSTHRVNLNADATYTRQLARVSTTSRAAGRPTSSSNSSNRSSYPNGYYRYYWNQSVHLRHQPVLRQAARHLRLLPLVHLWHLRRRLQRQPGPLLPGQLARQQVPDPEPRAPHRARIPAEFLQSGHRRRAAHRIRLGQEAIPRLGWRGIPTATARCASTRRAVTSTTS